jgi:hypothetical protein
MQETTLLASAPVGAHTIKINLVRTPRNGAIEEHVTFSWPARVSTVPAAEFSATARGIVSALGEAVVALAQERAKRL